MILKKEGKSTSIIQLKLTPKTMTLYKIFKTILPKQRLIVPKNYKNQKFVKIQILIIDLKVALLFVQKGFKIKSNLAKFIPQ
jgi:hypothetical protein